MCVYIFVRLVVLETGLEFDFGRLGFTLKGCRFALKVLRIEL